MHGNMRCRWDTFRGKEDIRTQSRDLIAAYHRDWAKRHDWGFLEFQNQHTGEFMAAEPSEGLIYVNVGDMLMHLSNGNISPKKRTLVLILTMYSLDYYPSATHRVTVPASVASWQASRPCGASCSRRSSLPASSCPVLRRRATSTRPRRGPGPHARRRPRAAWPRRCSTATTPTSCTSARARTPSPASRLSGPSKGNGRAGSVP